MLLSAFAPIYNNTGNGALQASTIVTVAVASTAVTGALPTAGVGQNQLRMANTTANWMYVNLGNSASVAAAVTTGASLPIAPGAVEVITVDPNVAFASVNSTGTGSVVFTRGEGM